MLAHTPHEPVRSGWVWRLILWRDHAAPLGLPLGGVALDVDDFDVQTTASAATALSCLLTRS